jgi:hypothetical protein
VADLRTVQEELVAQIMQQLQAAQAAAESLKYFSGVDDQKR